MGKKKKQKLGNHYHLASAKAPPKVKIQTLLNRSTTENLCGNIFYARACSDEEMETLVTHFKPCDGMLSENVQRLLLKVCRGNQPLLDQAFPKQAQQGWISYGKPGQGSSFGEYKNGILIVAENEEHAIRFFESLTPAEVPIVQSLILRMEQTRAEPIDVPDDTKPAGYATPPPSFGVPVDNRQPTTPFAATMPTTNHQPTTPFAATMPTVPTPSPAQYGSAFQTASTPMAPGFAAAMQRSGRAQFIISKIQAIKAEKLQLDQIPGGWSDLQTGRYWQLTQELDDWDRAYAQLGIGLPP